MATEDLLNVFDAASTSGSGRGPCGIGSAIGKLTSSSTGTGSCASDAACLNGSWQVVRSRREQVMDEERKNRDFSKGPVWDPETSRWLVEIRYPDGSRFRKRLAPRARSACASGRRANQDRERHLGRARRTQRHVRRRDEAISRVLEGPAPLTRHAISSPSLTLWEAHLGRRRCSRRSARSRSKTSN